MHQPEEQIRLRMVVHAGEINYDNHGVTATSINLAFRLLDALSLKEALANSPGVLGVIVSSWIFDEVVRHSLAHAVSSYWEVRVVAKETAVSAWIHLPDAPRPPRGGLSARGKALTSTPHQLPAHTPHFVGRREELAQLAQVLAETERENVTVGITTISGTAGVGKTALAVHWARQVAGHFPDGQLYVNLRGFDPTDKPMQAIDAIRGFLDAFEIPPERIPASLDAQSALYRSLLADSRVLVVLDNARDAEQVRPLLPNSPACLVVVTSREKLAGLIAQEGARPIILDVLDAEDSTALLDRVIGHERTSAEPDAVREIIAHCAGLPLPLAIVAARAATNPDFPLQVLVDELANEQDRLDALESGDPDMGVRAVLSWSYRVLSPAAARLFRLLGLPSGPDVNLLAAASLGGGDVTRTRGLLTELARAHILDEHVPQRYRFHDLLRAYAAERATDEEPAEQRLAAINRVLDHYLHTSVAAAGLLEPCRDPGEVLACQPGVSLRKIAGYDDGMDWFAVEYPTLLAAARLAARVGLDHHAWQLPWTLSTFLDREGRWHDRVAIQQVALAAADRLRDAKAASRVHRNLGRTYAQLARHGEARDHYQHALRLCRDLDDFVGEAHTHYGMSWACERQGHHDEALNHAQQALDLYRAAGNRIGEVRALTSLGWNHALLGYYQQAIDYCQQSLDTHSCLDDRDGKAATLHSLAYAHHHLGHYTPAIEHYERSLVLWRDLGDHYNEATSLDHLGNTLNALDEVSAARDAWKQALRIFEALVHPDGDQLRAKLAKDGSG